MNEKTLVILITGFLGSGKTTFLNRIIDHFPQDLKLTILMNEFGEIGIDGMLVDGEEIDMMEISRGSIFCVCVKTDFIKGLYELNSKTKPDLLIIESTGVANPTDLKRDLKLPIFDNRFKFTEQFCIIDAAHFLEAFEVFASVEKQLATSTVFIINKCDLVSEENLERIKDLVRDFHPDPRFFETSYAKIPFDSFPFLGLKKGYNNSSAPGSSPKLLSTKELNDFISESLENPEFETTPPDQLASVTYKWHGDNLDEIREMAKSLPADVVRAKGFVRENNLIHLFSYVMGDWTVEVSDKDASNIKHVNMVVFIGSFKAIDAIADIISTPNWSAGETLQPFGQISKM
jgi:G3E family GTPase